MKKVLPLLMLASTCLASCGDVSFTGKYKFLLGRQGDAETRVSIEMDLKNDDSGSPEFENFKKFDAKFELSGVAGIGTGQVNLNDIVKYMSDFLPVTIDENNAINLPGFYKVQDIAHDKYGNKVKIAFDLGETLNALVEFLDLDPTELISHFLVAYCNGSSFTFQLPVSLNDLQMQLAWYGLYVDYNPYLKAKVKTIADLVQYFLQGKLTGIKRYELLEYNDRKLPGEQDREKRFGTHPALEIDDKGNITKNEIGEMNTKYQGLFSNTFLYEDNEGVCGEKLASVFIDIEDGSTCVFPLSDKFDSKVTTQKVIIKKDVGITDYDFSQDVEAKLSVIDQVYDDGSYHCQLNYLDDTKLELNEEFYQEPFVFRDFHDIKIELKKE